VFCPNCGTQNPEAAETCSKCNFALKGVVAPKFKGTMLMMNQPQIPTAPAASAAPPVPPVPASAGQRPGPPGAPPMVSSKLKGTMVGVAPMALPGQSGQAPVSVPSVGGARGSNVPPTPLPPPHAAHLDAGPSFSPPVAQQGVNPLGGTVAADASGFARPFGAGTQQLPGGPGYPAQQGFPGPFGAPPPGTPPPGQQPVPMPYEPSGYGAAPPNPYGYGAYGAPPQGQGQQPGAMVPFGQQPGALLPPHGSTGASALTPWLLPVSVIVGGVILSVILSMLVSPILGLVVALLALGGGIWTLVQVLRSRSAPQ
jgi:hypothetical protein